MIGWSVAWAAPWVVGLGDGHDGDRTVTAPEEVARGVPLGGAMAVPGATVSAPGSAAEVGDVVLVWQSAGAPAAVSGDATPVADPLLGTYGLARVVGLPGKGLLALDRDVGPFELGAQVVVVPQYRSLSIDATGVLSAPPWDGATGGIVAALVQQTARIDGGVDAVAVGLRGGAATADHPFNDCQGDDHPSGGGKGEGHDGRTGLVGAGNVGAGGGGGNCANGGGGGGGSFSAGGRGGHEYGTGRAAGGLGGTSVVADPTTHLLLGGGGGAGSRDNGYLNDGAAGGGVVVLVADVVEGVGAVRANGGDAAFVDWDGAGGGGGGGTVVLLAVDSVGCGLAQADGGRGGSTVPIPGFIDPHGPGGGGGGGGVWIAPFGACPVAVSAGASGLTDIDPYGAEAGQPGRSVLGKHPPLNDADEDGFFAEVDDCDDTSAEALPGGKEQCGDGLDNDCLDGDAMCDSGGGTSADTGRVDTAPADTMADDTAASDTSSVVDSGTDAHTAAPSTPATTGADTGSEPTASGPEAPPATDIAAAGCGCAAAPAPGGWAFLRRR